MVEAHVTMMNKEYVRWRRKKCGLECGREEIINETTSGC